MDGALVLFLLTGAVGGFLAGLVVGWLFSKPKASSGRRNEAPEKRGKMAASPLLAAPSLGLMLRRGEQGLEVTLDGVAYQRYAAMPADSRRRLKAYLQLAGAWIEGKPTEKIPTAAMQQRGPAFSDDKVAKAKVAAKARARASHQQMIEQIDEIVRELQAQSALSEPVRVVTGLEGGVNILVGLKRYDHIEEVPDGAVRALVHRAVEIWESRQ